MNYDSKRFYKTVGTCLMIFLSLSVSGCDSLQKDAVVIANRIFSNFSLSPVIKNQEALPKETTKQKPHVKTTLQESSLLNISLSDVARNRLGIQTSVVKRKSVQKTRTLGGEVMVPAGQTISVSAPTAGVILAPENSSIPVVGTSLSKNQSVLRLLMLPPEKDLLASRDALESAQNRHDLAVKKAERAELLLKEGAGSVRSLEEARRELEDSRAGLRLAKSVANMMDHPDFKISAKEFTPLEVGAPINGIIENLHVAPGQRVAAGSALFQMTAQNSLWVRLPVYAGLLNQFDAKQTVNVQNLSSILEGKGVLAQPVNAPPSGNPLAASVNLFYELPTNDRTFQPGQKVAITLKLASLKQARVVPRSAIVYDIHGGTWVYLNPQGNDFVRSRVELETIEGNLAILTQGPAEGTKVVSTGVAELFGTEFGSGK
ncbi:MAG: hypothetical protein COV66_02420 [Nitrospinae bacterium CG11_big_fil_rev_8_21_14_0_20_45_15]|nr:MAG: hypothetical protein COV66_02420 [Nitrospinae bacterium CG11_big_fil_rev_8_21_14_0_20_45_15]